MRDKLSSVYTRSGVGTKVEASGSMAIAGAVKPRETAITNAMLANQRSVLRAAATERVPLRANGKLGTAIVTATQVCRCVATIGRGSGGWPRHARRPDEPFPQNSVLEVNAMLFASGSDRFEVMATFIRN